MIAVLVICIIATSIFTIYDVIGPSLDSPVCGSAQLVLGRWSETAKMGINIIILLELSNDIDDITLSQIMAVENEHFQYVGPFFKVRWWRGGGLKHLLSDILFMYKYDLYILQKSACGGGIMLMYGTDQT